MKFPNVAEGVKKIYTAEILSLVAAVCGFIALIMTIMAAASAIGASEALESDYDVAVAAAAGMAIGGAGLLFFGLATAVIAIIAFIITIQGVTKASKDETEEKKNFKNAFYCIIASIALTVLSMIFSSNSILNTLFTTLSSIASVITTYFVLYGISYFAEKIGNSELAKRASGIVWGLVAVQLLSTISKSITEFVKNSAGESISIILAIVSLILNLVYYILYLKLLSSAKDAFSRA
ncbi:MAG: hypothetical protein K6G81_10065 [Lachnospiraceae bacterium]|nr:hypothetical protein [Lachnospiraceae bacterium]